MKTKSTLNGRMSIRLRVRARRYRLAAAVSDAPRDVATFHNLAMMFERLSEHFAQVEARVPAL
jgi:hypothetical protein